MRRPLVSAPRSNKPSRFAREGAQRLESQVESCASAGSAAVFKVAQNTPNQDVLYIYISTRARAKEKQDKLNVVAL